MKLAEISEIDLGASSFQEHSLTFTKLHGNGNDFMLVDEMVRTQVEEKDKKRFAVACCHRHLGIGADGILFLSASSRADLGMRLIQPDGSEAEMCGNGIRCLAKYAWDRGYVGEQFDVETLAGIIPVQVREGEGSFWAKVNMGLPRFDRPSIPACGSGDLLEERIGEVRVSAVNTGVPHAVVFVDDMDFDIMKLAPGIRHSSLFPEGANVNFVKIDQHIDIRTFERGVEGETLSCGTGSVAAASVARRLGLAEDEVLVRTRGGPLIISFDKGSAFMEGPAVTVFSGELSQEYLWNLYFEA